MTRELWHELQRRGFMPDECDNDWADLHIGGSGPLTVPQSKVRVEWDDGRRSDEWRPDLTVVRSDS